MTVLMVFAESPGRDKAINVPTFVAKKLIDSMNIYHTRTIRGFVPRMQAASTIGARRSIAVTARQPRSE